MKFLRKFEPSNKVPVKDEINNRLPIYSINGFIEEVLYLSVDFNAIRKRINK